MKKFRFVVILVLIFVATSSCFATTYREDLRRSLEVVGYVAVYHNITVTPLVETGGLGYGMPFDITGDDVKYSTSNIQTHMNSGETEPVNVYLGRNIATWGFSSTIAKITINIKASPMVYSNDSTKTLDYYISFKYKFAKFDAHGSYLSDDVGYLSTDSTSSDGITKEFENQVDQESFPIIASDEQEIWFMFMNGVDPSSDYYPAGSYTATVTIELIGE